MDTFASCWTATVQRRFVWGSDMPNVERYCTYRQTLTYFADSADYLSDDDRKLIFRENALALFRR